MKLNIQELSEGEIYVGCIGDAAGTLHHVILLPGDNDDATHEAQLEWAKSIGGDLPNRIEQAMLWANHRDQFKKDWYWSNETHHAESGWAWSQGFDDGYQGFISKDYEFRARAVRRLPIQSFSHFEDAMTTIALESIKAELAKYRDAPVVAYVNFADNGNIRIWTSASDHAMHIAEDQGFVLQRLIVKPEENK